MVRSREQLSREFVVIHNRCHRRFMPGDLSHVLAANDFVRETLLHDNCYPRLSEER